MCLGYAVTKAKFYRVLNEFYEKEYYFKDCVESGYQQMFCL